METLVACGASIRLCSCNIHSTQNEVAAALAEVGVEEGKCGERFKDGRVQRIKVWKGL